MATTTAPRREKKPAQARRKAKAVPAAHKKAKAAPVAKTLTKVAKSTAVTVTDGPSGPSKIGRTLALKAAKTVALRALRLGAEVVESASELTMKSGSGPLALVHRQVPIQRSLDVAVPVGVAWHEWMTFSWLPEGLHRVHDIEREDDGRLSGRTDGSKDFDWEAEILEEREAQSFAWQSIKGSDCAGLVTFHRLSDRLTRLELTLDIVPTSVPEALALSTHVADHRAETDLRRFKARTELISPDTYETNQEQESDTQGSDGDE